MNPISLSVLAIALLGATRALAADADLSPCREIENDLDRLACYDRVSGRTPTSATIPTSTEWKLSVETSEMTDDKNVFISVTSDDVVNCGWSTQKTTLMLRCRENTTSAYFVTGCHMTSSKYNSYGDLTYRLDDAKSKTQGFEESTNKKSLGLWRGSQAIPFIKSLLGHERLLVRMTPYGENAFTVSFKISGLEDIIKPLRDACKW